MLLQLNYLINDQKFRMFFISDKLLSEIKDSLKLLVSQYKAFEIFRGL